MHIYILHIFSFHRGRILWSSYRKLVWVRFKPTTIEFRADALTDWAIGPWVQLALRANFVQVLQFHRLFRVRLHFSFAFLSRHVFAYVYMYICQHMFIFIYVYIYVYICLYVYMSMYIQCRTQIYFLTIESVWVPKYWAQIFLGQGLSKDFRPGWKVHFEPT